MAAARPTPVKPEFGPALPELLGKRVRRPRLLVGVLLGLVALAALGAYLAFGGDDDVRVVHREPGPVFNLRHAPVMKQVPPRSGELLRLEARRGDLFVQSFVVRAVTLPAYAGEASGFLPIFAARYVPGLRRRYAGFVGLDEGKARVNEAPGYAIGFRAKLGERTLWGREILLLPDEPGVREGVALELLQTPAAGANRAGDVGAVGAVKKPLRSFRFGTDAKGSG